MHDTEASPSAVWAAPAERRDPDRLVSLAERDAIVATAREMFLDRGYHDTSVEQVALRAGCTEGAVYRHFEDKPALLFQIVGQTIANPARARVELHPDATESLVEDRRMMAENVLHSLTTPAFNLLLAEFRTTLGADPEVRERFGQLREAMTESLVRGIRADNERNGVELRVPIDEFATLLVSLVNGLVLEHVGVEGRLVSTETIMVMLDGLMRPVETQG